MLDLPVEITEVLPDTPPTFFDGVPYVAGPVKLAPMTPEEDHQARLDAIHAVIAESPTARENAQRGLHSLHLRFALSSTERVSHWDKDEVPEATVVTLYGVQSPPFGKASPTAQMKTLLVPPHIQEFFTGDALGSEYDVILFRRPKK